MSEKSQPADRMGSPATIKSEPGSPSTPAQPRVTEEGSSRVTGGNATPPVQNGFHGSGSDSDGGGGGGDAPLDFSMKTRNRSSEGGMSDGSDNSKDGVRSVKSEPMDFSSPNSNHPSTSPPSNEGRVSDNGGEECTAGKNGLNRLIGEPPVSLGGKLPGAVGAAMPGLIPVSASYPTMPFQFDPRQLQQMQQLQAQMQGNNIPGPGVGNKAGARPFKAYPKDPLSMPLGFYGMPGMMPFPSIDTVTAQAMNMSSEEVFTQYRNYVLRLQQEHAKNSSKASNKAQQQQQQEQKKQIEQLKQQLEIHQKQQLQVAQLQQQQQQEQLRELQQRQQEAGVPSQPSPSGKSSISETSTTARSNSSSPNTTCTTPIPTSPNGGQMAAGPTTGSGNGEATTSSISPESGTGSLTPGRKRGHALPEEQKDGSYWERRRKNNEAAKRSRDSRRAKEDEIAIRAAFLEQENLKLRVEVAALKNETAKLRCMLYNS